MRKEVITETDPKSPVSEIFRALRTNLQYMKRKAGCQTILYTSTIQGEGKSFVALNTAVTFAQAGKNVLIIDADMRRPRQHKVFEVSQYPGLSNYLSGVDPDDNFKKIKLDECIKKTGVDKLYIMPAGVIPPNPSELLETPKLPRLIEKLEQVFDIVIIDGAPCLLVTDSTIISRYADSTVLVAASGRARIDDLKEAKARIQHVGGNLVGIVLNRVRTTKSKYESKYYYASNDRSTKSSKSSSYNRATHVSGMKKKTTKKNIKEDVEAEEPARVIERAYDSKNKEDREIKKLGLEEEEDFSAKSEKTLKKEISKIKDFEIDEKTESDILRGLGGDSRTNMPPELKVAPSAEEPKSKDSTQAFAGLEEIRKKARSKYNFDDLDAATSNIEKAAEIEDIGIDIPLFSKNNVKKPHEKKAGEIDDDLEEEYKKELKEAIDLSLSDDKNKYKKDKNNGKKNDKKKSGKHNKEDKDRYKSKMDDDYEPPLTNEKDQQKIDDILSKINRYK